MKMYWNYFKLELCDDSDVYVLQDETGQLLTEDGSLVHFASFSEAADYLEDNGIRGNVI